MRLRTSLGDLRLVFFLYTSLEISPKLGYILYVCALVRLIFASSKEKILRLNFLRSNLEVKFANLSHRDLYRKNVKLKNVRRDSAFAPR